MKTTADKHPPERDDVQKQARFWLRLITSGDANAWDARAFRRWLAKNPRHQTAFNQVKQRWELMETAAKGVLLNNPDINAEHRWIIGGGRLRRRAFIGALLGTAAAGIAGVSIAYPPLGLWPSASELTADERTAVGEQRTLVLTERVSVTLNTLTSIRRQGPTGGYTGLDLIDGEAAVDLQPGGEGFSVAAGNGLSWADAARFEVRNIDNKVCVTCISGIVKIRHPAGNRQLFDRQRLIYNSTALSGTVSVAAADIAAWRQGELVFDQSRLADVLEEINRYRPGRVMLMNASVRNSPVSGRFTITYLDSALFQLQHMFALHARSLPGGLLILS